MKSQNVGSIRRDSSFNTDGRATMTQKYIYWQDDEMWLGYLDEYPDYWTQGETLEELKENLVDIYKELSGGHIPHVREAAELEVS